jgi:hypothetical protein
VMPFCDSAIVLPAIRTPTRKTPIRRRIGSMQGSRNMFVL